MDSDFHFQTRLFLPKLEESNSISNYMTGYIRAWLVTHLCKPANLVPDETILAVGFSRFTEVTQLFGRCFPLRLFKALEEEEI